MTAARAGGTLRSSKANGGRPLRKASGQSEAPILVYVRKRPGKGKPFYYRVEGETALHESPKPAQP